MTPSGPILTEHHAFAPSRPMLLSAKFRLVRVEFSFNASARAWQETNDLRTLMKHTAHTYQKLAKISPSCFSSLNLGFRHHKQIKQRKGHSSPMIINDTLHCYFSWFATLCQLNLLPDSNSGFTIWQPLRGTCLGNPWHGFLNTSGLSN